MRMAYEELLRRRSAAPGVKVKLAPLLEKYTIPRRTFNRCIVNGGKAAPLGRHRSLVDVLEDRLVRFVAFRSDFNKPLDGYQIQSVASSLASSTLALLECDVPGERDEKESREYQALRSFKASDGWLECFRERHKDVFTPRDPELVPQPRAVSASPHSIRNEVLTKEKALAMLDAMNRGDGRPGNADRVPACRKWNTDESGSGAPIPSPRSTCERAVSIAR